MAVLIADENDPRQIFKLHEQLLKEGRITPEEYKILSDAMDRFHGDTCFQMIDID